MYASRVQGARLMDPPPNLLDRIAQIESGTYQEEWDTVLQQVESTDEALD
jgi:hypothetical protein